ncbi:MAG: 1-acyl-sn-glycerol-3-phosphate acyltransferase [Acidimicrobiaceae bacterium]|nr:1-acyl-sn-glycerol-3-phosphate acyltransferase [Acidimicrobiaceae bacterium]
MTVLPVAVRRALLPVSLVVLAGLGLLFLVLAIVGALVAPLDRRWRLARASLFAASYCAVEIAALVAAGAVWTKRVAQKARGSATTADWLVINQRILRFALDAVLSSAWRWFRFRVSLDEHSVAGPLDGRAPALVLARHGGPGDSFGLVHLLMSRYAKRVRVVAKSTLQLDPALDILLNRTGGCFLGPGGSAVQGLRELVASLDTDEVALLFPEGGNWSPARRIRAIQHLQRQRRPAAAQAAELMDHVLPARPAGVLAILDRDDDLPVLFAAHAGLDKIVTLKDVWLAIPFQHAVTVRLLTGTPPPAGDEARLAWLRAEWAVVDEWIDAHHSRIGSPASGR